MAIRKKGEGRFVSKDGLSLWYKVSGRGPALLVPTAGWGPSSDQHMKSMTSLEGDFMLVHFDTRGSGRSQAPNNSGYAFELFLDDIEALRLHLRLEHWLIFAHSYASSQAMGYAIRYPKACRGLFIVDGTVNIEDSELDRDARARMKRLRRKSWFAAAKKADDISPRSDKGFKASIDGALPLYFASARAAEKARHFFSESTYRVNALAYIQNVPEFTPGWLGLIRTPTAIFQGDLDVITTPLEARRLHKGIANSVKFTIRGAGHFPWLQQPETFFKEFSKAARKILRASARTES